MGLLESLLSLATAHWLLLGSSAVALTFLINHFNRGLHQYPGPFLAGFTNWWRFIDVLGRRSERTHIALHEKYGEIVRLGPNVLSFANPKALKDIYGLKKGYVKTDFYPVQQAISKGDRLPSLFSTVDEPFHAQLRRCVNGAFSMSSLVQYEPGVDTVTLLFLKKTQEFFASGQKKPCDFFTWLQYYAFDVIGQLTYSKRHGFIDTNSDVDGIVSFLRKTFDYVGPVGQIPWLDLVFVKNPILRWLDKHGFLSTTSAVVRFAQARMAEKRRALTDEEKQGSDDKQVDLLSKFLKAKDDHPDFFHDGRVLVMAVSMSFAGSETTAISLAAVFYYLIKNPDKYEKLMQEIDTALASGKIQQRDGGLVSWTEAQSLPYLDGCIQEALRLHPAVGLLLERLVPPEGAMICGKHIPGGTIVGCNAWVMHRRKEVFGDDAETFRPERWLECDKESRKEMEGSMFQFGAGTRTCIGKNIALLELYKLVPSFLLNFKISMADPNKGWTPHNAWFVRQKDFNVLFETRSNAPITAS